MRQMGKMERMIGAVWTAGFALCLLSLILGCGGGRSDGRTVIRFWQFWTEPRVKAVLTKAIEEFEEENPEFRVEVTDLTWNDGHQKIVAAFAGGQVPDLLELGSDWIAEFASAGALTDLSNEYAKISGEYIGWPQTVYGDRCWALPWYISTRVLYQNDSIARVVGLRPERPPITWDELRNAARVGNRGRPSFYGIGINAAERHRLYKKFLPFLWAAGGDILSADQSACVLTSPEGERALKFYVDLAQFGIVERQAALDEMFMSGRLLFHLSGDWLAERIRNSGLTLEYSVHLMPFARPGEGIPASFAGGEYLTIPARAAQPLGAIRLARHLLAPKNIFNLCIATGCPTPVHAKTGDNPYFSEDPIRRVFMQQLLYSLAPPLHPRWVEIEAALEWGIEQAQYGKLAVSEALAQTCERIEKILAETHAAREP